MDAIDIIEPVCAVFRRKLKSEGLKYTPERAQVLDVIVRQAGLFEPDQIITEVKKTGIRVSKATVYRTIKLLVEAGIIQRVMLDADASLYHCVFGRAPSDLLIRLDTREAVPLDLPELRALRDQICQARGLVPQGHRLHIFATLR
jgi:Fur family ferric uptake transcriptional regulator